MALAARPIGSPTTVAESRHRWPSATALADPCRRRCVGPPARPTRPPAQPPGGLRRIDSRASSTTRGLPGREDDRRRAQELDALDARQRDERLLRCRLQICGVTAAARAEVRVGGSTCRATSRAIRGTTRPSPSSRSSRHGGDDGRERQPGLRRHVTQVPYASAAGTARGPAPPRAAPAKPGNACSVPSSSSAIAA